MGSWKAIGTNMAMYVQLQVNTHWRLMMDRSISQTMLYKRTCLIMENTRKVIRLAMMSWIPISKNTIKRTIRVTSMTPYIPKWKYDVVYVEDGNWCHASLLRRNRSFQEIQQLRSIRHGLYDRRQSRCLANRNQQQPLSRTIMSSFSLSNPKNGRKLFIANPRRHVPSTRSIQSKRNPLLQVIIKIEQVWTCLWWKSRKII